MECERGSGIPEVAHLNDKTGDIMIRQVIRQTGYATTLMTAT